MEYLCFDWGAKLAKFISMNKKIKYPHKITIFDMIQPTPTLHLQEMPTKSTI